MKEVEINVFPDDFRDVMYRSKHFEIVPDVDNIQRGDELKIKEWDGEKHTGLNTVVDVKYVMRDASGSGLMSGYCIVGF